MRRDAVISVRCTHVVTVCTCCCSSFEGRVFACRRVSSQPNCCGSPSSILSTSIYHHPVSASRPVRPCRPPCSAAITTDIFRSHTTSPCSLSAAYRTATSLGAHPVPSIASYPYVNKASSPTLVFASNIQEQRSCGEPQHLSLTHYPRQHHHYPLRAHCRRPSHPRHCSRSRLDTTRFCGLAPTTARAGTGTHPS
jgi:hypothetical protein